MNFSLSVNIANGVPDNFNYIVTPNAQKVYGNIVDSFQSGLHTFSIIGTYGTGKSSFLMALEKDLLENGTTLVLNKDVFSNSSGFEFLNIVGDYQPLSALLAKALQIEPSDDNKNIFSVLSKRLQNLKSQNKFLFIFIDEFGKILEHAANNNPEKELYFIQTLAEFINVSTRNVILITTLHQNFGTYSQNLSETQRNEWFKVKGRFKEIVFAEPVEQLLFLAAENLYQQQVLTDDAQTNFNTIFSIAKKNNIISDSFTFNISFKLYPLDPIAASCLTLAIQRYGQNERTLFSFLNDTNEYSIRKFKYSDEYTYNLSEVYDYIAYNFYSSLLETNTDSTSWRAINVAIERVESVFSSNSDIKQYLMIIKAIGLLNIFYNGAVIDKEFIITYSKLAMGIKTPDLIIDKLTSNKIIRYASYKSQYILFEGTDINIEDELYKASSVVPFPSLSVAEISPYIKQNIVVASESYYKTGTPRYFEYTVSNEPIDKEPSGDVDGFINLIFPLTDIRENVINISSNSNKAILYALFENCDAISKYLYEIKKHQYLLDNVVLDDRIAKLEIQKQQAYIIQLLNEAVNNPIEDLNGNISWYFNGKKIELNNRFAFNKMLSVICDNIYNKTPIIKNELFNKQKISSAISIARVNLLDAMNAHWQEEDFGFEKSSFPPEKTIYYTLLKDTGIHRKDEKGFWILGEPSSPNIKTLWDASMQFLKASSDKQKKLSELVNTLKSRPFKLKQGVIDIWIPIFLFIKQQEFALYNKDNFVIEINKEVFELLQKRISDFSIKGFDVSGIKLEFFNMYREFLNKERGKSITSNALMDTIRPFFTFYNRLNQYAKTTRKFDYAATAKFRDVLATAKDPCKAFLEDIPAALGYNNLVNTEYDSQYFQIIKTAVHELVTCYDSFIDRIENTVVSDLGLPKEYSVYKNILENRYSNINKALLTPKSKAFLDRVLSPSETKREFYEKIGLVVFDRKIETITDREEARFLSDLIHLFSELERHTAFENIDQNVDEIAFNVELATSKGGYKYAQTFRLPKAKLELAEKMEKSLNDILTGNNEFDICVLLDMLNKKI